jgi:hypothetical protein
MQGSEQDIVTFPLVARRMKDDTSYHMAAFSHPFSHPEPNGDKHQQLPKHKLVYNSESG